MKIITIKNTKGEICDYRSYIDIDINEEIENMQKLIDKCRQKMIEVCESVGYMFDDKNGIYVMK